MSTRERVSHQPFIVLNARERHIEWKDVAPNKFDKFVAYTDWRIRSQLDTYPPDHPVTRYIQDLANKVLDTSVYTPHVYVYKDINKVDKKDPNAFVLPNGSIYVSDSLIALAGERGNNGIPGSVNEIMWVLKHEENHAIKKHAQRSFEDSKRELDSIYGGFRNGYRAGAERLNEAESDINAFIELDAKGYNPKGGDNFLAKLGSQFGESHDIPHGSATERQVTLASVRRAKNLQSLSKDLEPVDIRILELINQEDQRTQAKIVRFGEEDTRGSSYDQLVRIIDKPHVFSKAKVQELISNMNLGQLLITLETVCSTYQEKNELKKIRETARGTTTIIEEMLPFLALGVWERLYASTQDEQKTTFLFYTILRGVIDVDITNIQDKLFNNNFKTTVVGHDGKPKSWSQDLFSFDTQLQNPSDLTSIFLDTLDPKFFEQNELFLTDYPDRLVQDIVDAAMKTLIFSADGGFTFQFDTFLNFADTLVSKLEKLYETQGVVSFSEDKVRASINTAIVQLYEPNEYDVTDSRWQEFKEHIHTRTVSGIGQSETLLHENEVVQLFKDFYQDPKFKGFRSRSEIRREDIDSYKARFEEILNGQQFSSAEDVLRFVATIFGKLQEDRQLWDQRDTVGYEWNHVLQDALLNKIDDVCTDKKQKILARFKTLLLLEVEGEAKYELYDYEVGDMFAPDIVTPEYLLQIYQYATMSNKLGQELGINVETPNLIETERPEESMWVDNIKEALYDLLHRYVQQQDRENFRELLFLASREFTLLNHLGQSRSEEGYLRDFEDKKVLMLASVFDTFSYTLEDKSELLELYHLSSYFEDISLATQVQQTVWSRLVHKMDFQEGFTFIQTELGAHRLLSLQAIRDFVNYKAVSDTQIEQVKAFLGQFIRQEDTLAMLGKTLVLEELVEYFLGNSSNKKFDFLLAGVGNGKDSQKLREYLYKGWKYAIEGSEYQLVKDQVDLNKIEERLYRLDAQAKLGLIHWLLVEKGGLLTRDTKPEKRAEFVQFLAKNYVLAENPTEEKILKVMSQIMQDIITREDDPGRLFFILAPLLMKVLFVKPDQTYPWEKVIRPEDSYLGIPQTILPWNDWKDKSRDERREILQETIATLSKQRSEVDDPASVAARNTYENRVFELFGSKQPRKTSMGAIEFLLEVVQQSGAEGVRMLQDSAQLVELPRDLEEIFFGVYDKLRGQEKPTAWDTILQDWPNAKEALKGLEEEIGGGSMATVYASQLNDGTNVAVKVLNPNLQSETREIHRILKTAFGKLAATDPAFAAAPDLLEEIYSWVTADSSFEDFLDKDSVFRGKYDGYTVPNSSNRYSYKIPKTYTPFTTLRPKNFVIEEYVEGTNLTEMEKLKEQGHDLKQVMSLVTKAFFKQITDGSLVLSNIHPGNIRVTQDNQVVAFDRNYYLTLSGNDKQFLAELQVGMMTKNIHGIVDGILRYVGQEGRSFAPGEREKIIEGVQALGLEKTTDATDQMLKLSVFLRQNKVNIPLRMTLILQNIFFLDRLSKRAGFSGIQEAFLAQ